MLNISGQSCLRPKMPKISKFPLIDSSDQSFSSPIPYEVAQSVRISKLMPLIQSTSVSPIQFKKKKLYRLKNPQELKLPGIQSNDSQIPAFEKTLLSAIIENIQKRRDLLSTERENVRLKRRTEQVSDKKFEKSLEKIKQTVNTEKKASIRNRLKRIPSSERTKSKLSCFNFEVFTPILKTQRLSKY